MSTIHVSQITQTVSQLCIDANYYLSGGIKSCFIKSLENERHDISRRITEILVENADIAARTNVPICQDTGMAVVFVEIGQGVRIEGGSLREAINAGVADGYARGYLRKSVVADPITRVNTNDNTPAVIHYDIVDGDRLTITVAPKGFGSENMSALVMLTPSAGLAGVEDFVVKTVAGAGSNPCPPIIVGVGVGGTMEKAALMAKRALLRDLGTPNDDPSWAEVEQRLLGRLNELNIGPAGQGGSLTAMGVHIDAYPTHIAGLPVAVNIGCHVTRHAGAALGGGVAAASAPAAPEALASGATRFAGDAAPGPGPGISGKKLCLPLSQSDIAELRAGDMVLLSGPMYTARDAAHKRLVEMLERGEQPPFDLNGQAVYYVGPCPAKPGQIIGSAGPTTSGRMDKYSPALIARGLKLMIGKGERSPEVHKSIADHGGAYFVAVGGAGAYMARCVKSVEVIAFDDLGTEAVHLLEVEDFPVIVAIDKDGNTIE